MSTIPEPAMDIATKTNVTPTASETSIRYILPHWKDFVSQGQTLYSGTRFDLSQKQNEVGMVLDSDVAKRVLELVHTDTVDWVKNQAIAAFKRATEGTHDTGFHETDEWKVYNESLGLLVEVAGYLARYTDLNEQPENEGVLSPASCLRLSETRLESAWEELRKAQELAFAKGCDFDSIGRKPQLQCVKELAECVRDVEQRTHRFGRDLLGLYCNLNEVGVEEPSPVE
ncbi:uncharacterized protein MKK02DRAFT_41188 [Dioszegia hungarica]|uniref:Uncharacterized protein n=1 Tax=Dioszegia hungarica TaxID=4972 RepID=A0AA38H4X9_9TREE|nr:uncharacterized protein MKK02DRAFT_41188 [Dioszegia hungarica]KAI9632876.1 hypothetical protein MKK02DRAFT_41188 [Dioszegia hungarica]